MAGENVSSDRQSERLSWCGRVGVIVISSQPSAITPQPSMKRERLWLNQVSTEFGEGQTLSPESWAGVRLLVCSLG